MSFLTCVKCDPPCCEKVYVSDDATPFPVELHSLREVTAGGPFYGATVRVGSRSFWDWTEEQWWIVVEIESLRDGSWVDLTRFTEPELEKYTREKETSP